MKSWYKDWYGKEVPSGVNVMGRHGMMGSNGMHMGVMGDETDLSRLEQAKDFDRAFVEEMIPASSNGRHDGKYAERWNTASGNGETC